MRTEGALIPNNDIQVIWTIEKPSDAWEWQTSCQMYLTESPSGAQTSLTAVPGSGVGQGSPIPSDSIWIFRTDTVGFYTIQAIARREHVYDSANYVDETDTITIEVAAAPVGQITQSHELVDNGQGLCDEVGILVTATKEFNEINGTSITSTLTHQINKKRDEDLMVNIKATTVSEGESSLLNNDYAPLMGDIEAVGDYLDVTVTEGTATNVFTYDFGGGFQSLNKFHYNAAGPYAIQVKDQFGCLKSVSYTATDLPTVDPTNIPDEFYISKGNSFRFVDRSVQPYPSHGSV